MVSILGFYSRMIWWVSSYSVEETLLDNLPSRVREAFPGHSTLPRWSIAIFSIPGLFHFVHSNSAAYVSVLRQTFRPGVIVCLKAPSDADFPEFGEIIQVFVPEESKLLLVRKLLTDCYCEHYNSYSVNKSSSYALTSVGELAIHDVFHLYRSSASYFIVIRSCNHVEMST